jgi:ankyrin repeat protein
MRVLGNTVFPVVIAIGATVVFCSLAAAGPAVDFAKHVQPLLREHCVECHGPSQQMNGLRLDRRRDVLPNRVGANGAPVVPGNSAASRIFQRISGTRAGQQMPPAGPLTAEQIDTIKAWIDAGAEWPDELAGGKSSGTAVTAVDEIAGAIRDGDQRRFAKILRDRPDVLSARGNGGWTALMYAAAFGRPSDVRALLAKGVDPNIQNDDGATALIYAVDDLEKTKALLDRGAKLDLRSGEGRTALMIAASGRSSYEVAKLLLDRGADATVRVGRQSSLQEAALAGDLPLIRLLMAHGADAKGVFLGSLRAARCLDCMDLLLPAVKPDDAGVVMVGAAMAGNGPLFNKLLERGVKPHPAALQFVAISPDPLPKEVIARLIKAGADPKSPGPGLTAGELARRHRNTNLLQVLKEAGVADADPPYTPPRPEPAATLQAALERSIPPLQRSDVAFLRKAGCVSCHNNSLTAMTVAAARRAAVRVDERIEKDQTSRIAAFLDENREHALEGAGLPGAVDTVGYILLGMAAAGYPSDAITDAWAKYVKAQQAPDGSWPCITRRPPLESSDFETTAAAIRVVRTYGPKALREEYERAAARGLAWLEKAQPKTVEDRSFQILGLVWGRGNGERIRKAADALAALQRPDGGWEQRAGAGTEAYSTGQALVALRESGTVARTSEVFAKGIQYLKNSQLGDGSWYVASRAVPFQPYFDSEFPHGPDQFISAAATNWASMALISALR